MSQHKRYLAPADVAEVHAQQVIEALNAMRSARQLADAVDVPGEPDIGVRLARRILDRRDELGGFTTLQQVYDVPLIGPERFTELVVCLSDAPWPDRPLTPLELLRRDLTLLRRRVDALGTLGAGRRVMLRAVQPLPFLGQTVTLIATVTEEAGRPAVDVPVTLLATRGRLSASDGYTTVQGHLITARTGIDGRLRVTLSLPTSEELSPLQASALAAAIERLGAGPATPADAVEGLRELARQYAWEINLPLRQAIDIYARDFAPALLDTVTPREALAAWRQVECGLLAFAPLGEDEDIVSSVAATATLNLGFRDWIHPFVEAAIAQSREQSDLRSRLRDATAGESDAGRFIGTVYARAGDYVAAQRGLLGTYIGRKVAETSIREFIDRELPGTLPLETRVAVLPALTAASRTIATTDAAVLQGLVRTRTELKQDLDTKVGREAGNLAGLAERFASLAAAVADLPRTSALDGLRSQLTAALAQVRNTLDDRIDAIRRDLDGVRLGFGNVVTRSDFEQTLGGLVTTQQLSTALQDRVTTRQLNTALQTRVTIQQLNTALAGKADVAVVNDRIAELDRSVAEIRFRLPG
jgi:hypothetical protein